MQETTRFWNFYKDSNCAALNLKNKKRNGKDIVSFNKFSPSILKTMKVKGFKSKLDFFLPVPVHENEIGQMIRGWDGRYIVSWDQL